MEHHVHNIVLVGHISFIHHEHSILLARTQWIDTTFQSTPFCLAGPFGSWDWAWRFLSHCPALPEQKCKLINLGGGQRLTVVMANMMCWTRLFLKCHVSYMEENHKSCWKRALSWKSCDPGKDHMSYYRKFPKTSWLWSHLDPGKCHEPMRSDEHPHDFGVYGIKWSEY